MNENGNRVLTVATDTDGSITTKRNTVESIIQNRHNKPTYNISEEEFYKRRNEIKQVDPETIKGSVSFIKIYRNTIQEYIRKTKKRTNDETLIELLGKTYEHTQKHNRLDNVCREIRTHMKIKQKEVKDKNIQQKYQEILEITKITID